MDSNGLHELHQAALGFLTKHESGALGLDEQLTSDIALVHAEYLIAHGLLAVPVKLAAREPQVFNRCTILIARDQAAMQSFLADLRSRTADGSATMTLLMH
jgi:hypothetical protein